jgi:hypothetical protein
MLKIKFKLIISEVEMNEAYTRRQKDMEEKIIEKEIEIYDKKGLELYEKIRNDDNIIRKMMKVIYELNKEEKTFKEKDGENIALCRKCLMPINVEQEKEKLWKKIEFEIDDDMTKTGIMKKEISGRKIM